MSSINQKRVVFSVDANHWCLILSLIKKKKKKKKKSRFLFFLIPRSSPKGWLFSPSLTLTTMIGSELTVPGFSRKVAKCLVFLIKDAHEWTQPLRFPFECFVVSVFFFSPMKKMKEYNLYFLLLPPPPPPPSSFFFKYIFVVCRISPSLPFSFCIVFSPLYTFCFSYLKQKNNIDNNN